jgi:hypothetical protein
MAKLYFRITRAEDSEKEDVAPMYEGTTRHPLAQHADPDRIEAFAAKLGFDIVPLEVMPYNPREWPLTAIVYVQTAHGSRCSQTARLPARRRAP